MQGFLIGDIVELTAPFKYIGQHGPQVIPPGTRGQVVGHNPRKPLVRFAAHRPVLVRPDMLSLVDIQGKPIPGCGYSWDHIVRLMREAAEAERIQLGEAL